MRISTPPLGDSGNSPGWILGHLNVINGLSCSILGGPGPAPQDVERFGPGSSGHLSGDSLPTIATALAAEHDSATALRNAISTAAPKVLDAPQQTPFLRKEFPLVRNLLGHVLVSHLSLHTGQLSAWRRARGMPPMLQV